MKRIVILTGAGISAESGLGTFRDTGGIWSAATTEDGNTDNTFVMSGLFSSTAITTIEASDFNNWAGGDDDDVISATIMTASDDIFGCSKSLINGANVPSLAERSLWLQFKAPTTSTIFEQQNITITIGAQAP